MSEKTPILELSRARKETLKADRPRSRLPVVLLTLASLSLLLIVPYLLLRPQETLYRVQTYSVSQVTLGTVRETTNATGKVVPERVVSFSAPADGTLSALEVSSGDTVRPGVLLARLKSPSLEGALETARASLRESQDALVQAELTAQGNLAERTADLRAAERKILPLERELSNTRELYAAGGVARIELEKLEDSLDNAQSEVVEARTALERDRRSGVEMLTSLNRRVQTAGQKLREAREQAAGASLKSNLTGVVLEVKANAGDTVKAGELLFTVADTRRMRIEANVDETTAARVQVGQAVVLQIGQSTYPAEVSQVSPQAVTGQNGSSVPIRVRFSGPPPRLRPNISATLEITVGLQKEVLTLPRAPFLSSGGERLIYVLVAPDRAERREIRFGAASAERIEVVEGLSEGEWVLTSSMEAYKDQPQIAVSPTGQLQDRKETPNGN